jgi:hypothetical protein
MRVGAMLLAIACEEDPLDVAKPVISLPSTALDFGVVPEGQEATKAVAVENPSLVPLMVGLALAPEGSADFSIAVTSETFDPQVPAGVDVTFRPVGRGEDRGTLILTSDDPKNPRIEVSIHGGPIDPKIAVSPDPIDFGPASAPTVVRPVEVRNEGTAILAIIEIVIDPGSNTDFTLRTFDPIDRLGVGERVELAIDYVRSHRATAGQLIVRSDDPATPEKVVRLLPDPLPACSDQFDNDDDNLVDFPDDPGCTSPEDDSEDNPPECDDGTTIPCGTDVPPCVAGTRTCANRVWGPCEGETPPGTETCNGADEDCDTRIDEEISETCTINGCGGARACLEGSTGVWTDCIPVGGAPETCDGNDEDCDGTIDNGIVEACNVSDCMGTRICVPGGMGEWTACQVTPALEICDGMDQDCDSVDDNAPDLTCGMGACARTVAACAGGMDNTCTPGTPVTEICNNQDDDCDGTPDNLPNLTCGQGICMRTVPACAGGANNTCTPGPSGTEICNLLDDNCDGQTDEGGVCGMACGPMSTGADTYEVNNTPTTSNPVQPYPGMVTRTYEYDVTLPSGDADWFQFNFPGPIGGFAQMDAQVLCVGWGGPGCGATQPTVGLASWYFDDCFPQQDDIDNGTSGLAFVTSSGAIASIGICGPQYFRVRAFPSTAPCAGEAANARIRVTVTFSP